MKLLFATGNKNKLREAGGILGENIDIVSPAELGISGDVEETGSTLLENSRLKAWELHKASGMNCFADDTGLEVDALGGEPGVRSARYAGEEHDNQANMDKLLRNLDALGPDIPRSARFRTVVTLILDGKEYIFNGTLEGHIGYEKAGCGGFGYDPIFFSEAHPELTLAEISAEEKNAISHRGMALRNMATFLSKYISCPHGEGVLQDKD